MMDRPPSERPRLQIPLHTIIQLTPANYGCDEQRFVLPPGLDDEVEHDRPSSPA